MDRGGGRSAPGVGERGWFPAHPSVSADRRAYAPAGIGPSSHDHVSGSRHTATDSTNWRSQNRHTTTARMNPQSQYRRTTTGCTNWQSDRHSSRYSPRGRSCQRAPGRRQMQGRTEWKQVQPVACDTSAAQGCPSSSDNRTDSEVSSYRLNCHAKTQDGTILQSGKSGFSDCSGYLTKSEKTNFTYATSAASGCPSSSDRDRTDSEINSHVLNCPAKTQGGTLLQSEKSDCSSGLSGSVAIERGSGMAVGVGTLALDSSFLEINLVDETSSASTKHAGPSWHSDCKAPESAGASENAIEQDCSKTLESESADAVQFDICPPKVKPGFKLKESLLETNRAKRNQEKLSQAPTRIVLRDGMVLLKGYVSLSEQVKIVKECRRLGLGHGGFYQPGYRDGAKLNLQMMCLGKNWDPETCSYADIRPTDGAKPPPIPIEFYNLVERSIKESHELIAEECGYSKAEAILPGMTPDICIVNFYSTSGRLGLHQDRDESERSLHMGLPVVSVSIGDSAEFLYGDKRDVDKAEKVLLESGDVLIFGGKSRHVFHGVSSVKPETAPKPLLEQTDLRPGRLNLTFRKY